MRRSSFLAPVFCFIISACLCWIFVAPVQAERQEELFLVSENIPPVDVGSLESDRQTSRVLHGWSSASLLVSYGSPRQVYQLTDEDATPKALTALQSSLEGVAALSVSDDLPPQLFLQVDPNGKERYQVIRIKPQESLTKWEVLSDGSSRNGVPLFSADGQQFVYSTNRRNPQEHDIVLSHLDHPTEARTILQAPSTPEFRYGNWRPLQFSPDNSKLLVQFYRTVTDQRLFLFDLSDEQFSLQPVGSVSEPGSFAQGIGRFDRSGRGIYYTSDVGGDYQSLCYFHLESGEEIRLTTPFQDRPTVLEGDAIPGDIVELSISSDRQSVAFIANVDGYLVLYLLQEHDGQYSYHPIDIEEFHEPGQVSHVSFDPTGTQLAFDFESPIRPSQIYTYNVVTHQLKQWTVSSQPLDDLSLVQPSSYRTLSNDGMFRIPFFYYKPLQAPRSEQGYPVVIYLHGGPAKQFSPAYRPRNHALDFQRCCRMGIAVIAPNVRGSTGYGRAFTSADDKMHRETSIHDVGSILQWIAEQPDLDASRVAVMGRSYGGFLTLASLIAYPDRIHCGMETCGIGSFANFLEKTAPYRAELRRNEYGDERDPETRQFLDRISPLSSIEKLKQPVLLAHGMRDPRVPFSEFELMRDSLLEQRDCQDSLSDVWSFVAPQEGHVFKNALVNRAHGEVMASFLQRFLLDSETDQIVADL